MDDEAGKHVLLPRKTKESLGDENVFVRARMSDSPWEKHLPPFSSSRDSQPTDSASLHDPLVRPLSSENCRS